jgi:hypothetical protein
MLAEGEDVDVEVRWEDQKCINEFGRNNVRLAEAQDDLNRFEVRIIISRVVEYTNVHWW